MGKQRRLTGKEQVDVVNAYTQDLEPMISIAKRYGVTRQGVFKILARAGVDTTKRKLPVSCTVCGTEIMRHKARIRKQLHHFCSGACYHAFLHTGNGNPLIMNRHSSRLAREIVSQYFALSPANVVHHEDRNQLNNILSNLKVFANQGDHVRHHRGFDVVPLWEHQ